MVLLWLLLMYETDGKLMEPAEMLLQLVADEAEGTIQGEIKKTTANPK
jgi:hypothetical protein